MKLDTPHAAELLNFVKHVVDLYALDAEQQAQLLSQFDGAINIARSTKQLREIHKPNEEPHNG